MVFAGVVYSKGTLKSLYSVPDHLIGRGSFSTVYAVTELDSGRKYALKRIRTSFKGTPDQKKEEQVVVNEIISLHRCGSHPFILQLQDVFRNTHTGGIDVVLEYVPYGDLFQLIQKRGHFSEFQARGICKQLCSALAHLHKCGIVHRDLKPENLLVATSDALHTKGDVEVKIADFGLAHVFREGADATFRRTSRDLTMSTRCGSRLYCAPEVLEKVPYSAAVDIWGAGVVVCMCITGDIPYPPSSRFRQPRCEMYKSRSALEEKRYERKGEPVMEVTATMSSSGSSSSVKKGDNVESVDEHEFNKYLAETLSSTNMQAMSFECKEAVRLLLSYLPKNRLTLAELHECEWFSKELGLPEGASSEDGEISIDQRVHQMMMSSMARSTRSLRGGRGKLNGELTRSKPPRRHTIEPISHVSSIKMAAFDMLHNVAAHFPHRSRSASSGISRRGSIEASQNEPKNTLDLSAHRIDQLSETSLPEVQTASTDFTQAEESFGQQNTRTFRKRKPSWVVNTHIFPLGAAELQQQSDQVCDHEKLSKNLILQIIDNRYASGVYSNDDNVRTVEANKNNDRALGSIIQPMTNQLETDHHYDVMIQGNKQRNGILKKMESKETTASQATNHSNQTIDSEDSGSSSSSGSRGRSRITEGSFDTSTHMVGERASIRCRNCNQLVYVDMNELRLKRNEDVDENTGGDSIVSCGSKRRGESKISDAKV